MPNLDVKFIVRELQKRNCIVFHAFNIEQALNLISDKTIHFDFIISDMGRIENGDLIYNAGEIFYDSLIEKNIQIPIIFFTLTKNENLKRRMRSKCRESKHLLRNKPGEVFKKVGF